MVDWISKVVLWTGVEVKQASCASLIFSLSFFGVLASIGKTRPQSLQPPPGTALESSVLGDEAASEVSFSDDFFLGSLFLVFPGAPGKITCSHFSTVILSKFVCSYKNSSHS